MRISKLYIIGIPNNYYGNMEYGSRRRYFEEWSKDTGAELRYLNCDLLSGDQEILKLELDKDITEFKPDTIFVYFNHPINIFDVIKNNKHNSRVVFWHCDPTSIKERWGIHYDEKVVDFLFSCSDVEIYKKELKNTIVSYLPHEVSCDWDVPVYDKDFETDVAFIGQTGTLSPDRFYGDRKRFMKFLFENKVNLSLIPDLRHLPDEEYIEQYYKEYLKNQSGLMNKILGSGKIFLGIDTERVHDMDQYFSNRPFIIMGYGAFYLSFNTKGIEKVFTPGYHIDVFNNFEEGLDKINFYLENPELRNKIAQQGKKLVFEKHLTRHRLQDLIKTIETEIPTFSGYIN